jgi:serine/threonine protein phosphatase PrpC
VHVGDSRLYVRRSHASEFAQISKDDTLGGVLTDHRVSDDNPANGLLQFVGMGEDLQPHVTEVDVCRESIVVLSTDGVHGIAPQIVHDVFQTAQTTDELGKRLLTVAEAVGTRDNASVVVIQPSEVSSEIGFRQGSSLIVWTPSDRLDIWLPMVPNYRAPIESTQPYQPAAKKSSGTNKKKKASKAKPDKKQITQESLDIDTSNKPQLRIEFSDSTPKVDD